jgi:hypothetical protein
MCFFCPISNARNCGASCGLCGKSCPGAEPETRNPEPETVGLPNGMTEADYTLD